MRGSSETDSRLRRSFGCEEICQRLVEAGAVDEVRTRTEVSLNAQGRNMASEAMNEQ